MPVIRRLNVRAFALLGAILLPVAAVVAALLLPSTDTAASGATFIGGATRQETPAPVVELNAAQAIVLGLVEGITEYLPVSSTGHLVYAERLMDLPTEGDAGDAVDAYTVIIQLGAILAVLVISWQRIVDIAKGLTGRSASGRQLLVNLLIAFAPAAALGLLFNDAIDEHLLAPVPIAIAWFVGGLIILLVARRVRGGTGAVLDTMTRRQALLIGAAQAVSLIPGTSRSLVTIVAAVLVGMSLAAAVEFSFLLGLATLGAATGYKLLTDGSLVFDTFGVGTPLLGIVVAGVSAWLAVRTFVEFLKKRSLGVFGWYRLAAAASAVVLMASGVI